MSNRRVKAIDYDDDDYDSYEDEYYEEDAQDGLTEDDKLQLQEGTTKVRSILGDQTSVTDKEIHDALWHYYYDIEKTVAYLKNMKKPKAPKETKAKPVQPKSKAAPQTHGESLLSLSLYPARNSTAAQDHEHLVHIVSS